MLDKTNDQITVDALDRVRKVRTETIMTNRFYGALIANVEPRISRAVPRAGTNGKVHFWNPDYVMECSWPLLRFTLRHEAEHDARHHHTRRGNRDPERWNVACDYAINIDLKNEGEEVPEWAYCDAKYRGMSAENIYRTMELDEQKQQEEQQKQDQQNGNDEQDSQDQGDEGNDEAEDEGADGDQSDEAGGDEDQGSGADDGAGEEEGQGEGSGTSDQESSTGQDDGDGAGGEGQDSDDGEPTSRCNDQRLVDEVFDAGEDRSEFVEEEMKWERIVRQAAAMSKGNMPGHFTREIERANNPPQDWREVLRDFIDSGSRRVATWDRPNRRLIGSGLILPGNKKDGLNKVVFIIDTSGSMDDVALACVNVEAQAALDDGAIDEVIVVYGDTKVTRVDTYHEGDEMVFDPRGGGGTEMRPLYDYVANNVDDPSLIINFTDLFIDDLEPTPPDCPVLFAVTGYPDQVRDLIAKAPWGAPGIDVGAH